MISLDILLDLQVSYDYEPDNEVENIVLLLEVLNFMYFKPNDFYKVDFYKVLGKAVELHLNYDNLL